MCNICDDWRSKKLSTEEAFKRINDALHDQNDSEKTGHLVELSARILDEDVPMSESDPELDKRWHDENEE